MHSFEAAPLPFVVGADSFRIARRLLFSQAEALSHPPDQVNCEDLASVYRLRIPGSR